MEPDLPVHPAAFAVVRWITRLMLALLVANIPWAGWLALENWDRIKV